MDLKGLSPRFVRKVALLSIGFWSAVLFLPSFLALVYFWRFLEGRIWGPLAAGGVVFIAYFCVNLGLWTSRKMIVNGHLHALLRKLSSRPKSQS
jgi:hypothetical protein